MKILEVIIDGFWGEWRIDYTLSPRVNILIGKNGSGKTHFIKIVEAVLSGNLESINDLDFQKVVIKYDSKRKPKDLIVEKGKIVESRILRGQNGKTRKADIVTDDVVYTIDGREYISSKGARFRFSYEEGTGNRISEADLRKRLSEIFKLVILSVDRLSDGIAKENKESTIFSSILEQEKRERAFESIIKNLGSKRIQINEELTRISRETEKKVLEALIIDSQDSKINLSSVEDYITSSRRDGLLSFFSELGFSDKDINKKIEALFKEFSQLPNLIKSVGSSKELDLDSINKITSLMSSLGRIEKVMEVYVWTEQEKNKITLEWDNYISTLFDFMPEKYFDFDNGGEFTARSGKKILKMDELSSGEKQIFYMLTKAYLESGGDHIFLADEPELSLHIEWQEKILDSMVRLNGAGQYIVATHSPEIASSFADNITAMEEIFSGNAYKNS